jgi:hypothetical protein
MVYVSSANEEPEELIRYAALEGDVESHANVNFQSFRKNIPTSMMEVS